MKKNWKRIEYVILWKKKKKNRQSENSFDNSCFGSAWFFHSFSINSGKTYLCEIVLLNSTEYCMLYKDKWVMCMTKYKPKLKTYTNMQMIKSSETFWSFEGGNWGTDQIRNCQNLGWRAKRSWRQKSAQWIVLLVTNATSWRATSYLEKWGKCNNSS